ncbi:hypothetical protein SAMN04488128_103320 [Chitinophaga eiseniae]|uniref:Uncharacterized protein n=1 Tax=Chitinophaga eiseniae TaxID=634771 RepID=A0A1T4SQV0_9BACT|nr:hypothetical protein SAMN04488128_103320 [Chitinophaga eiseniae]
MISGILLFSGSASRRMILKILLKMSIHNKKI